MVAALFLAVSLLAVGACDDDTGIACTLIGCTDALYVDVVGSDGAPAPGRYTVSVTAGEAVETCAFTIGADRTVTDSGGCAGMFDSEEDRVHVQAERVDGRVTVDVTRDDALLARLSARPVYLGQFPNGPDCGEVCQTATLRVDVP